MSFIKLGSCREGFAYSAISRKCDKCSDNNTVGLVVCAAGILLVLLFYSSYRYRCLGFVGSLMIGVVGTLFQMNKSGLTKIVWSTYQIIESVPSTVVIEYPSAFQKLLDLLTVFSFSYLDVKCIYSSELASVWAWSIAPLFVS